LRSDVVKIHEPEGQERLLLIGNPNKQGGTSPFRWAILALVFVGEVAQGLLWFSAMPLVLTVEKDLHLQASQVALWVNLRLGFVCLLSIPLGLMIDSFGSRRTARIGFLLLGVGGVMRGLVGSYSTLLLATAVFSLGSVILSIALPKALASWFSSYQMGMASGIYLAGYGTGASLALSVVHPLFGNNWQECLRVTGLIGLLAALLWWMFAREPEDRERHTAELAGPQPIATMFLQAARTPVTWLLTMIFLLYASAFTLWFTFGFAFLSRYRAVSQNTAGVLLMFTMLGYTAAALTMPALSDRWGYRRPFLMFFSVLASALFLLMTVWKWPFGIGFIAFLIGTFFGTTNPLVFTIAAEARELGSSVMGASVGIISSVSSIAGFLVPTLAGAYVGSLATADEHHYQMVLTIAAACVGMVLICALLLRETGRSSQDALAIEAPLHPLIPTAEP
jgi:MFS transporter, ACS family, glucarate transporter